MRAQVGEPNVWSKAYEKRTRLQGQVADFNEKKWLNEQSSMIDQVLSEDDGCGVKQLLRIIYSDAVRGARDPEATKNAIEYDWSHSNYAEWKCAAKETTNISSVLPYNESKEGSNQSAAKRDDKMLITLPKEIVITILILLILSVSSLTTLILSVCLRTVIINPWYLISLTLGSTGLLFTAIVAIKDRGRETDEKGEEK